MRFATTKSGQKGPSRRAPACETRRRRRSFSGTGCLKRSLGAGYPVRIICLLVIGLVGGAPAVQGNHSEAALKAFLQAQLEFKKQAHDSQAAWQFGRACFDLADYATNSAERAAIAGQGIEACRQSVARDSNSAPGHYYLGLNLGQLARTRDMGALKLVDDMEREFIRAIELDGGFDYAGPERSLALLYRDAPAIISIGSRSKARRYLQRALQIAPQYPDNRLVLIESCLKWGDRSGAARELKTLDEAWPKAKADFAGPAWATSWADWAERREQARKKLDALARQDTQRH